MAEAAWIEPDLEFKRTILGLGTHDLTSCYQCGTCSVVCPLSTEDLPFPRKEMVWVQWGLKDRLVADPAVWICHQCNLCNIYCPRDAKPADVMAALREYSIQHYAVPKFMGEAVSKPGSLPLLFGLPSLIFLAILTWLGHLTSLPGGEIVFSKFIPVPAIEIVFVLAVGSALLGALVSGMRYWREMSRSFGGSRNGGPWKGFVATLMDIFRHSRFRSCEGDRVGTRESFKSHLHKSHLAIFYGFLGLMVTTASVGIGIYAFGYLTPWPLWHPVKILGNVSGVVVLAACGVFLFHRLRGNQKAGRSTYPDWLLLGALAITTFTGFLSESSRLSNVAPLAYWTYFVHLLFVFFLLVYIPYSKFAHLVYRFVAMLYQASSRAARTAAAA